MPLANGQVFAGYRILRLLGSGGMGEVYLAQHPRLPRRDALKVLALELSADEEYREADLPSGQIRRRPSARPLLADVTQPRRPALPAILFVELFDKGRDNHWLGP
jgi:serine/threonine protein kinase